MPVEERRKPIHGGLGGSSNAKDGVNADFAWSKNLPCCRHPRQAHPTPFLIRKLGIARISYSLTA